MQAPYTSIHNYAFLCSINIICRSHTEARSFESCWNFLLYLALHFLFIALQNTSLTASRIAVPRLSNIVLVATEFWPRRSANKRIPNKLGTCNRIISQWCSGKAHSLQWLLVPLLTALSNPCSVQFLCGVCTNTQNHAESTWTLHSLHRTGSDLWGSVNYCSFVSKSLILSVGRFSWRVQDMMFICMSILVKEWWWNRIIHQYPLVRISKFYQAGFFLENPWYWVLICKIVP